MPTPLPCLVGRSTAELAELLAPRPDASWRARQIAQWIYRKAAQSFDSMDDLPRSLRSEMAARYRVSPLYVEKRVRSTDDVDKLLVHRGDGQVYECVLLPYADRTSCCLSSQVGCPMGCTFCATGLGGFDRNLDESEIVGQYLLLQSLRSEARGVPAGREPEGVDRISRIVFMGMGEPLLNLEAVVSAMRTFHDEVGLSYRHMTVSTVGIVPQIRKLAELDLPIHLALSLHSPFDSIRDQLMPVNKKWPVEEVVQAMRDYQRVTRRKVTIEYLLIGGLTDSLDQAAELARLIRGTPSVVNVIPFNWVPTRQEYRRPERPAVNAFKAELKRLGINVTERIERGHDIAAACGQLAGLHGGEFARRNRESELPACS